MRLSLIIALTVLAAVTFSQQAGAAIRPPEPVQTNPCDDDDDPGEGNPE